MTEERLAELCDRYNQNWGMGISDGEAYVLLQLAKLNPEGMAETIRIQKNRIAELEHGLGEIAKLYEIDGWPGCGWQRIWQVLARIFHNLPPDAPMEDIACAELFRAHLTGGNTE